MLLQGLNERQKQAVTTTDGPVMVMAGAGSGKTKVLTHRIAYILQEKFISPYSILAVTFTNKAANEMKKRISNLINLDTKHMWISTFHSFCARFLRLEIENIDSPYNRYFNIIDEEDSLKIVKNVMKEMDYDDAKPKDIQGLISKSKNFGEFVIKNPMFREVFLKIKYAYQDYLEANNLMDFDDLIIQTIEVLKKNTQVLEYYQDKFQYILVDEFQDTNDLQYKLMFMLSARHHNIFVVGDDFQSIYSFRGAKIENINRFRKDFLEHELILLERNYRSTSEILNMANNVIEHNPNQIKKVMFTENNAGQLPIVYELENEKHEAEFVVSKIKEYYEKGEKYSDTAIMYRSNAISRNFEDVLLKHHIPYRIYGGLSFFARKEIKDMIAYIRVIMNYKDDFSFTRIINEPKRKIGDVLLEKLINYANSINCSLFEAIPTFDSNTIGGKALKQFYNTISSIRERINTIELHKLIDILLEETGYKQMLFIEDPEHERLDNVYELQNVLKEADEDNKDLNNEDTLNIFLSDLALRTNNDETTDDEKDCVILTTYHQAKGLEFKNVFMTATEEGIFPNAFFVQNDPEAVEEERRICYVGITRAKERLYITHTQTRMLYGRTTESELSRFIKEADTSTYKKINYKDALSETKAKLKTNDYCIGDKIMHTVWGEGIVVGEKFNIFIEVKFDSPIGVKTLLKNHTSFEKTV